MGEWQPIETAPKDGTEFLSLIGGTPYKSRYRDMTFCWMMHGNISPGASYLVHDIDGKQLLEKTKEAKYRYIPLWFAWILGFEDKPTHWQPLPAPPTATKAE